MLNIYVKINSVGNSLAKHNNYAPKNPILDNDEYIHH